MKTLSHYFGLIAKGAVAMIENWLMMLFFDGLCAIVITVVWNSLASRNGLAHVAFFDVWMVLFLVDFTLKTIK